MMNRSKHQIIGGHGLLWALLLVALFSGCGPKATPEIVAGTSLIADIVKDISDARVETYVLLPSASCPSQFDMKAGDIILLQQARWIVLQPWQLRLANITRTLEAAGVSGARKRVIPIEGNWMVPEIQLEAIAALAAFLGEHEPTEKTQVDARTARRTENVRAVAARARTALDAAGVVNAVVLCNEMQTPFARWVGFKAIIPFGRPEDWSVADTERLVREGRERDAVLVLDNLQSGGLGMSETLARDMGAAHVVLSNFPGGFPDTPDWETAFNENVRRLLDALERPRP